MPTIRRFGVGGGLKVPMSHPTLRNRISPNLGCDLGCAAQKKVAPNAILSPLEVAIYALAKRAIANNIAGRMGYKIMRMSGTTPPLKQGLYDPANEHDACGVGFVANIKGKKSHDIIAQGLQL